MEKIRIKKVGIEEIGSEIKFPNTGEIILFVKRRPEGITFKTD